MNEATATTNKTTTSLPSDATLATDILACRDCKWFWGDTKPYGPYPVYRTQPAFHPALKDNVAALTAPLPAVCAGMDYISPAIMKGCRRAPIMTIGINPNLAGFWPGLSGARACFPTFENDAHHAHYSRCHCLCQEALPVPLVEKSILPEGRIVAKSDGDILSAKRDPVVRKIYLKLQYTGTETPERIVGEWKDGQCFVLLRSGGRFKKDAVLGGFLAPPDALNVELERSAVGYHLRYTHILDNFSSFLRSRGLDPRLSFGEDVCQCDMVACASPGWKDMYRIDKKEVVENCVKARGFVAAQLALTQPRVIVFAGRSAFDMFALRFGTSIHPRSLASAKDIFGTMTDTVRKPCYLELDEDIGGRRVTFRARLAIAPHFSYDENYLPHCRFSPEAWKTFTSRHAVAVKELETKKRIKDASADGYVPVDIRDLNDFTDRHPRAAAELLRVFYEPSSMIAEILKQEFVLGNLALDNKARLARTSASCTFCVNAQWTFPEGCGYARV